MITAIDGGPVNSAGDVLLLLEQRDVGDTVKLTVSRGGKTREIEIVLQTPSDVRARVE